MYTVVFKSKKRTKEHTEDRNLHIDDQQTKPRKHNLYNSKALNTQGDLKCEAGRKMHRKRLRLHIELKFSMKNFCGMHSLRNSMLVGRALNSLHTIYFISERKDIPRFINDFRHGTFKFQHVVPPLDGSTKYNLVICARPRH